MVRITDPALVSATDLSGRYIPGRFLPDKAIDVIDEAGALVRLRAMSTPPELKDIEERLARLEGKKQAASDRQEFEVAARLRDEIHSLRRQKNSLEEEQTPEGDNGVVDEEVVAEVVKMCLEAGAKKVRVFDRSCNAASRCYRNSGIEKAASEAGADVSQMVSAGFSDVKLPEAEVLKEWPLYKPALEADVLINVPIAKNHGLTYLTMGIKNLMGIMGGDRGKVHWNIDEKLADLANFVRPQLTILDAYRTLIKNGPQGGSLKDVKLMKTMVAGTQVATVDAYGATLFGIKPAGLPHIVKSGKFGLGEIDLDKVNIEKVSLG